MKLIVTGATGLIGSEVLRQAVLLDDVEELIVLSRSRPGIEDPRIRWIKTSDFLQYENMKDEISRADALIWCLGISQTQVSRQEYERITFEYTRACAEACARYNPAIRFVFVSGDGADRSEKSKTLFKKLKGKAENYLLQSGLNSVVIARPDAVRPRHKNPKAPFLYKLVYPLFPLVELLAPNKIIWSDVLALALLKLAREGEAGSTHENPALRILGKSGTFKP